tara:strand:+ start:453 stop:962 length:510 start_codon:yes stop_codon:yes gene_type:complete
MNFFRILIIIFYLLLMGISVQADNHDTEQNIIEKAKEINQKVKKQQALKEAGMLPNDAGTEEPLPLNDPFVGDGSLGGGSGIKVVAESDEEKRNLSVFNFKLVGIIEGADESYASIVDENGDVLTLAAFEEIAPGVPLIGVNSKEIVFDNNGQSLVVINFKNQVIERDN